MHKIPFLCSGSIFCLGWFRFALNQEIDAIKYLDAEFKEHA